MMKVTPKGQVTIPRHIREKLGITSDSEVDFIEDNNRVYIVNRTFAKNPPKKFQELRGVANVQMTTDEIMALTRSDS